MSLPKKKTNLQQILDDLALSQAQLALLSSLEKYQVSLIASGTRSDCYISTGKKICKALSKISKKNVTLDDVFGDKPVVKKFRRTERKPKKKKPDPALNPIPQEPEPVTETQTTNTE